MNIESISLGHPVEVSVGPKTLGRVLNVTGEPVHEMGQVPAPIHRHAPEFDEQSTRLEMSTGIKVIDLLEVPWGDSTNCVSPGKDASAANWRVAEQKAIARTEVFAFGQR